MEIPKKLKNNINFQKGFVAGLAEAVASKNEWEEFEKFTREILSKNLLLDESRVDELIDFVNTFAEDNGIKVTSTIESVTVEATDENGDVFFSEDIESEVFDYYPEDEQKTLDSIIDFLGANSYQYYDEDGLLEDAINEGRIEITSYN